MSKFYKYLVIIVVILALCGVLGTIVFYKKYKNTKEDYYIAKNNEKAYSVENSKLKENSIMFQLTLDQLRYTQDSLITKMREIKNQLNLKDSKIEQLEYMQSIISKTDTIFFSDTIFTPQIINKDTVIKDKWYSLGLTLNYPNNIKVTPEFISDKYIFVVAEKETINPPKKCFLLRWFQKKHTVLRIEVFEQNPYIKTTQQRFIKILK